MFDDTSIIWDTDIAPSMAESNLILVNPPKKVKKMAARKGTKASRSAAAKKAAATRKRNAAKRSAAAKKAAATRKRNARKGTKKSTSAKRKASRSTASKRSAAAKKAAATRKRNAAKRSRAAKKAAATRKRNSGKRKTSAKRKSSSTKRSTKASRSKAAKKAAATRKRNANKRSRAAKKAAATRKRNARGKKRSVKSRKNSPARRRKGRMTKAQRSAAAKKAWRTRRRNGTAKRRTRKGRRKAKTSRAVVQKAGKNTYDSAMKAVNNLPGFALTAAYGAFAIGAYNAIKPQVWDRLNVDGFIAGAATKIGDFTTPNIGEDIGNFTGKALAVGTIAALGHLVSSPKALNLLDAKLTASAVGIAGLFYGAKFITEIATMNLGSVFSNLAMGDFGGAKNAFMAGAHNMGMMHGGHNLGKSIGYPTSNGGNTRFFGHKQLPMFGAHNNNMGMMHGGHNMGMMHGAHNNMGMMHGGHNLGMAMGGNKGLMKQMQSANTSALQMGGNKSGFFGTGRSLGATRVNLF